MTGTIGVGPAHISYNQKLDEMKRKALIAGTLGGVKEKLEPRNQRLSGVKIKIVWRRFVSLSPRLRRDLL